MTKVTDGKLKVMGSNWKVNGRIGNCADGKVNGGGGKMNVMRPMKDRIRVRDIVSGNRSFSPHIFFLS